MSAKKLTRLKQQRAGIRIHAKKQIDIGTDLLGQELDFDNVINFGTILERLNRYLPDLELYNDEIGDLIDDEEQLSVDIAESVSLKTSLIDTISSLSVRLKQFKEVNSKQGTQQGTQDKNYDEENFPSSIGHKYAFKNTKVPKLVIQKFDGNLFHWREFWDSFNSAIHSRHDLEPVEKFHYLRSYLTGDAKQAIQGLSITNENYLNAVGILEERFANIEMIKDIHFRALWELPSVSKDNTRQLRQFYDQMENHVRSLTAMGIHDTELRSIIPSIMSKLPGEIQFILEREKETPAWDMSTLRQKLKQYVLAKEKIDPMKIQQSVFPPPLRSTTEVLMSASTAPINNPFKSNSERPKRGCRYCSKNHWTDECTQFSTINSRKSKLKGCCFICLKEGHISRNCPATSYMCVHCKKRRHHHRSLCPEKFSSTNLLQTETLSACVQTKTESCLLASGEQVILQTARTDISNSEQSAKKSARILLDCGSQRTYISQKLASDLKLERKKTEIISVLTFGSKNSQEIETSVVELELSLKDGNSMKINANVVPQITGNIFRAPCDFKQHEFLWKNLMLADSIPQDNELSEIDILIGNDYYMDIILPERIEVRPGLYLLGSKLGWILTGRFEGEPRKDPDVSFLILTQLSHTLPEVSNFNQPDSCLPVKPNLETFWSLEAIGIHDSPQIKDDDLAIENFNETIEYDKGRYNVTWPWKSKEPDLPENFGLAKGRLNSLIQRLNKRPELLSKYDDIIQQQLEQGIIEKVDHKTEEGPVNHYIPHHAVITPTKTTTKVRIVYDASAKTKTKNLSLNECLYRGPVILQDLIGLLMRFRLNKIAILADIEKAFLQIGLHNKDRDVTRFLWLKNPKEPKLEGNIEIYRFCRVPFGIIASPFLLAATLNYHLKSIGTETSDNILENTYVDNIITGKETVEESYAFYKEAKQICQQASMNLRQWTSNSKEFCDLIPEVDRVQSSNTKVLGLGWNIRTDSLNITRPNLASLDSIETKRDVLKAIAGIFDPLGLFIPVTLQSKLYLQSLWKEDFTWDDRLNKDKREQWKEINKDLELISTYSIPRFIGISSSGEKTYDLICFSDASVQAYSTCIYLRISDSVSYQVNLLFAKSRLAPTNKELSIPRLELLAVLIGVRGLEYVRKQLKLNISNVILWTDSKCVLHWLTSSKILSVFVENRVKEIKSHHEVHFRYVATHENPADLATRGKSTEEIINSTLWWNGPKWLTSPIEEWPTWDVSEITKDTFEQIRNEFRGPKVMFEVGLTVGEDPKDNLETPFLLESEDFSSLNKLLRITAWCLRFITNCRKQTLNKGCLTSQELEKSRFVWEIYVQRKHFSDVIMAVRLKKNNNLKTQLGLHLDNYGLIRCHGRFSNTELAHGSKFPKLLPKKDNFTNLVIQSVHKEMLHSGVSQTLAKVRHEYWIPHGRTVVTTDLKKCRICKRCQGGPYPTPSMPSWPRSRVTDSMPFNYVGVDYIGPLYIKVRNPVIKIATQKVWICLFTCMEVRAVHLELNRDLTTEQFLLCLRRFIARRGKPSKLISDNASYFKLAKRTLDKAWEEIVMDDEVQNCVANERIEWSFITPNAPWMGGFYERLVGLVKSSLKKTIGKLCLSYEQLETILVEVEAVINSRPLVYVGQDINDGFSLTPADFISVNSNMSLPEFESNDQDPEFQVRINSTESLVQRWKKGQGHLKMFWSVWRDQYLLSLRERFQTHLKGPRVKAPIQPKIGDVVLIKEPLPRGCWKLGRIKELIKSNDGEIRSARVLLPSRKTLNRPIALLYPLECTPVEEETSQQHKLDENPEMGQTTRQATKTKRQAAIEASKRIKEQAKLS